MIYVGLGKKRAKLEEVRTVPAGSRLKYVVKKLKANGSYKFRIIAQKLTNGKYENICQSADGYFVTGKNTKYTNAKKMKPKKKLTVKTGRTGKIKGLRKGKCKVYLIGPNGVWKTVRITVK